MVREVMLRKDGKAEGVPSSTDKTATNIALKARIVVLAASACESVRILLNSESSVPRSANSSGKVGKYIMDTVGTNFSGQVPLLENMPLHNEDGVDGLHLYTPWWLYKEQLAGKLGFARGYHIEFGGGRRMPGHGHGAGPRLAERRQLRQEVQGRCAPLLRLVRRLRRPRRDDSQRGLLLRDRPAR